MGIGRLNAVLAVGAFACVCASIVEICEGNRVPEKFVVGGQNFAPLEDGLLKFTPVASGPVAMAPDHKFPLILAAKRTRRPDVLNKLRIYVGGWDITNKHYWASVGFTGAAGFILSILWFVSFGIALGSQHCCRWRIGIKENEGSNRTQHICLMLLLVFTCAASTGCILLSVGQDDFHDEVLDTLSFVVNQSDFTVQILRNVTDFLSFAKTISVEEVYLPADVQMQIDKLNVDLNSAANTLSEKTNESSGKIRKVIANVRYALIVVAGVMLVLAVLGFFLSILRHKHAMYIFIMSGWLLVAVTFALCGGFVILNNTNWLRCRNSGTSIPPTAPATTEMSAPKIILGTTVKLNGSNYVLWAQAFRIFMGAQSKLAYLLTLTPATIDYYYFWRYCPYYLLWSNYSDIRG